MSWESSLPVVDVYVASIPKEGRMGTLGCAERERELARVSDEKTRLEKYYVWRLLEYALAHSFGLHAPSLSFVKTDTGKWIVADCAFSLSHCDGAVAVAVSRTAVGVDIEDAARPLSSARLADKICNEREAAHLEQTSPEARDGLLLEMWTAKESLFKKTGKAAFVPHDYDTLAGGLRTQRVTLGERTYVLSVATDTPEAVRIYAEIDLSRIG